MEDVSKNPWIGLESYKEGQILYGRDKDIRELTQCVLNDTDTLLYGKSGIGKSSILNAGILPAARRAGYFPVLIRLTHKEEDIPYLQQVTQALLDAHVQIMEVLPCQNYETESFYEFFHRHYFYNPDAERTKLMIIFDQFEEIFTLQEDPVKKKSFFASIADVLNDIMPDVLQHKVTISEDDQEEVELTQDEIDDVFADLNLEEVHTIPEYVTDNEIHFIFTIREDFLSEFEYYSAAIPSLKQNRYGLRPINEEQASQIILRPVPGLVDESVAKLIIETVTGRTDFSLDGIAEIEVEAALLSLYLKRLYDAKEGDKLTQDLIEHKSGEIISDFYIEALSEISNSSVEYLERVLLNGQGRRDNVTVYDALHVGKVSRREIDILCKEKKVLRCFNYSGDMRLEFIHDRLCPVVIQHRNEREMVRQREEKERMFMLEKQKNRKRIFYMAVMLLVAVAIASFLTISNKRLDGLNHELVTQQNKILRSQQKLLSVKIKQLLDNGDSYMSKRLALNVMSMSGSNDENQLSLSFRKILRELSNANTAVLKSHESAVIDVAFSPVDQMMASASDTTILIWDSKNGKLVRTFSNHDSNVSSVAFSPDGTKIAAGLDNGHIRVYNMQTGKDEYNIPHLHKGKVRCVTFTPDGKALVSASQDRSIRFWNAENGMPLDVIKEAHSNEVIYLAFSHDQSKMASASADHSIKIWDTSRDTLIQILTGHGDWVRSVAFKPADANTLLSSSDDGTIRIWNVSEPEPKDTIFYKANSYVTRSIYSRDAKNIVASFRDGSVRVWDVGTQTEKTHLQGTHKSYANAVAISCDCEMFASAGSDMVVRLWDMKSPLKIGEYCHHVGDVINVTSKGHYIVTVGSDNRAICYDARRMGDGPLWVEIIEGKKFQNAVINIKHNSVALVGYKTIVIRDLESGEVKYRKDDTHEGWIYAVDCSPDEEFLVSAGKDKKINIWDWNLNPIKSVDKCHNGIITSLKFNHDGTRLASSSADKLCKIWDFNSIEDEAPKVLPGHQSEVLTAVFSKDGKYVLTASMDKTAKLWDVDSLNCVKTFSGHGGIVNAAIFSENEKEIVTVSSDKLIRIWDVESKSELIGLYGHTESVTSVATQNNGASILTVSFDGTLQTWNYPSIDEVIIDIKNRFSNYPLTENELVDLDVI